MIPYEFQRGETIGLALDLVKGEAEQVGDISAALKRVAAGGSAVAPGTAPAESFAIAPAEGGWTMTIDAAQSAALTPGLYRADARIAVGGGIVVTEPVSIRIAEPVTAP